MQGDAKRQQQWSNLSPDSPAFWPTVFQWRQPGEEPLTEGRALREPGRRPAWQDGAAPFAAVQAAAVPGVTPPLPVPFGHLVQNGAQQPPVLWIPVTLAQQPQVVTVPPLSVLSHSLGEGDWCKSSDALPASSMPGNSIAGQSQPTTATPVSAQSVQQSCHGVAAASDSALAVNQLHEQSSAALHREESTSSVPESVSEDTTEVPNAMEQRLAIESEPSYGTGWDTITEPIMQLIVQRLDPRAQQLCRLVSRHWNFFITNNLQAVQPRRAKVHTIREKFTSLTDIDFSACENVRNRNMAILAASHLKLKKIAIGHAAMLAHGKPRITNSALMNLSKIRTLTSVSLADCSAITNNAMQVLAALTNLRHLAFIRCRRISEKGLEFVKALPLLQSLAVFGCSKVTEGMLDVIKPVPDLRSLHLGHMRLQPERLAGLTSHHALQELTIHGEELSPEARTALQHLTQLTALGITSCYQISGATAMSMLSPMTSLQRLNLQSFGDLTDLHLNLISLGLRQLQQLKVVIGPAVTASGVACLASLQDLKAISFDSVHSSPMALNATSKLAGLVAAEFNGTTLPRQLLDALPRLAKLEVLNVSVPEPQNIMQNELVLRPDNLQALSCCTKLKRLDLSNTVLTFHLAADLLAQCTAGGRVRLEELCLQGCPIDAQHIQGLNSLFPLVHTHQNRRRTLLSSTWVWDETIFPADA